MMGIEERNGSEFSRGFNRFQPWDCPKGATGLSPFGAKKFFPTCPSANVQTPGPLASGRGHSNQAPYLSAASDLGIKPEDLLAAKAMAIRLSIAIAAEPRSIARRSPRAVAMAPRSSAMTPCIR
jgi:hypothetical protein